MLLLALLVATDSARIVDIDVAHGAVLLDVTYDPPDPDSIGADACDLTSLGGNGESFIVVDRSGVKDDVAVVSFTGKPCVTKATLPKARAAAAATIAKRGLNVDRKDLKIPDDRIRVIDDRTDTDDSEMYGRLHHVVLVDDNVVAVVNADYGKMAAGGLDIDTILIDEKGKAFIVDVIDHHTMRGSDLKYRVTGPLTLMPSASIAPLKAVKLDKACSVSIASNAALVDNVAATLSYALGNPAPVTTSQKERTSSIVYATDACAASANAIAAKIPGGATVDKLTWKTPSGIVVALGSSAAPK